ncbi:hypothetical protein, partial [Sphingomonas sp. CFBP 13733]|uniref:hypothetical protein n=1 Tax=Sphingomonas sp. CFBP 13733 TaxID=2775291 RepID=UPI001A7E6F2B
IGPHASSLRKPARLCQAFRGQQHLPIERKMESNRELPLTAAQSQMLDQLIEDHRLYSEKRQTTNPTGVGAPGHVMSIVTPFGRTTVSWYGRLEGVSGKVADIVLGNG